MLHQLSLYARKVLILVIIALGVFGIAGSANAQAVRYVEFEVRTGGDDLRGGDDNAFVQVQTTEHGRIGRMLNAGQHRLRDYSTTRRQIPMPEGTRLEDIISIRLYVRGFSGGIDGDNWNVDALRVIAVMEDDRREVLMNEFASPLIRFTGGKRYWWRYLR